MSEVKSTAIIMHPFPRRDEIDVAIDSDPRATQGTPVTFYVPRDGIEFYSSHYVQRSRLHPQISDINLTLKPYFAKFTI